MTQKEIDDLTIFIGTNDAFISKKIKGDKISKIRRLLTDDEIMNFFVWCIKSRLELLKNDTFTKIGQGRCGIFSSA